MDPILSLNSDYFTNSSLYNKTAELSELLALPEPFPTVLALLYGGTAFSALITNISAVIILIKKMKTSADLRKYLINLSAADLSMAVFSVPFSYSDVMYGYWKFPLLMCPLSRFMSICTICVSIFTLTAIGIERYIAIIYPLKHYWWSGSRTTYIICVIWILSLTAASPLLYYARAVPFNYLGLALYDCREEWEGELSSRIYTVILFITTFIIPFFSLTFLYGSIGIKTFKKIQPGEALTAMERVHHRTKIKVVKMLLLLVSVFLICWLPIQIFDLIIWCFPELRDSKSKTHYYVYFGLYFSCHLLSQFQTFMNPIINIFMSSNFKASDLKSITTLMSGSSGRFQSRSSKKKIRRNKMLESSNDENQKQLTETLALNKISNTASTMVKSLSIYDEQRISENHFVEV